MMISLYFTSNKLNKNKILNAICFKQHLITLRNASSLQEFPNFRSAN